MSPLLILLYACATAQIAVALLNFFLVPLLGWKADLLRLSLLPRQVFMVHLWFISITLLIFGALTWRFAETMVTGTNPVAVWLAAAIALFWFIRTVIQVVYYSPRHWWGHPGRTAIHIVLILSYGGLAATYGGSVLAG